MHRYIRSRSRAWSFFFFPQRYLVHSFILFIMGFGGKHVVCFSKFHPLKQCWKIKVEFFLFKRSFLVYFHIKKNLITPLESQ
jgi:hypothetical protein